MASFFTLHIERSDGEVVLYFRGQLDRDRSADIWTDLLSCIQQENPSRLVCDLGQVDRIDTAGIALLRSLEQRCARHGIELSFRRLPQIALRFLQEEQRQRSGHVVAEEIPPGWITSLGMWSKGRFDAAFDLIRFLGEFIAACSRVLRRPKELRSWEFLEHMKEVGIKAVLIICLLNAMTGLIVVFQGMSLARSFGATIYVADMVVRSVAGQMAPVLTAIIISGRSGAAFAANIGTMKIRQEVDILSVLNFNIIGFLVLPRVLAVAVATPFLIMLADTFGILGGMVTSRLVLDIPLQSYLAEVQNTLDTSTIFSGLIRGLIFGTIIGLTGCFQGLRTEHTANSVGVRATSATVSSIILIILADTIFAVLFNVFGW